MAMLVFLVLLLGICAMLSELLDRRLEEVLPLAACTVTLLVYGFALMGMLRVGTMAVLALCALCLPGAVALAVKRKRLGALMRRLLTPAALIYALLCVAIFVANTGKLVHTWDEFTYWADSVKVMTLQGVLPTDPATRSLYGSYPPALPLWEYAVQVVNSLLGKSFDESLLFMGYQSLMVAFFMPFFRGLRFRRPLEWAACLAGVPLCVLIAFRHGFDLLYSDAMLGVLGGFVCVWPLLFSVRDRFSLFTLCAALALLVLTKEAGLLYALAGVAAAYVCVRTQGSAPGLGRKAAAKLAVWPLVSVAVARLSWSLHVAATGATAQATFSNPVNLSLLFSPEGAWRRTTVRNFLYKFFENVVPVRGLNISISFFLAFVLLAVGFAALYIAVRKSAESLRLKRIVRLMFLTAALYIAGMGVAYVFKFYEDEALRLASYTRYLSIALLSTGFALFVCMINLRAVYIPGGMSRRASAFALAALMVFAPGESLLDAVTRLDAQASQNAQAEYTDMEARVRALCKTGTERIYIVSTDSKGFEFYFMRYRLRPLVVGDEPWNPIDGQLADNRFVAQRTPAEFMQCLTDGYDLLVLYHTSKDFERDYGSLFAKPAILADGQIYRVDRERRLLVPAE